MIITAVDCRKAFPLFQTVVERRIAGVPFRPWKISEGGVQPVFGIIRMIDWVEYLDDSGHTAFACLV